MVKKSPVALLRKVSADTTGYNPTERYRWVEFLEADAEEGETPARVRIRTSLTGAELEQFSQFSGATSIDDLAPLVAPNVVAWNIVFRDDDGTVYDVAPPSEGGPASFDYIPYSLFWQVFNALRQAPYRRVDPKSSTPPAPTEEP